MEYRVDASTDASLVFRRLRPRTPSYRTAPLLEGFNWSDCVGDLPTGEWYMVAFRSIRRDLGENLTLEMYDYGAYIEAQRRGSGLVFYFRGTPNDRRECLSFCIWMNREEAMRAAQRPLHEAAKRVVDDTYEWYSLERYILRKSLGQDRLELQDIDPLTQAS